MNMEDLQLGYYYRIKWIETDGENKPNNITVISTAIKNKHNTLPIVLKDINIIHGSTSLMGSWDFSLIEPPFTVEEISIEDYPEYWL